MRLYKIMKKLFKVFFRIFRRVAVKNIYSIEWKVLDKMLREKELQRLILWDGNYKFTDFETMLKIIKYDFVKWQQYRLEEYDCDNYAVTFAGLVPYIYGINNVGIVVGKVIKEDGSIGYHAWNVFLAMKRNGEPELYMYEPQTGQFTSYKSGKFGKVKYVPDYIIWG